MLDLRARDRSQLIELLGRADEELIELLGGRRREELRRAHREGRLTNEGTRASAVCVHHRAYPGRLRASSAPRLLYTGGSAGLLEDSDNRPTVALLGTSRPSDYGVEIARSLARALAGAGVLVVVPDQDGIARAARTGAEQGGCGVLLLTGDGLHPTQTAGAVATRGRPSGCLAGELPPGVRGRRWGRLAAERTVVHLSDVVLVVESDSPREPFAVELAHASGVRIAAVPGRATAALARGPLELLATGAALIRSAEDVMELLGRPRTRTTQAAGDGELPAALARVLHLVGSGQETPEQLLSGSDHGRILLALAQLELMGRVRRTPDGRYLATLGSVAGR